MNDQRIWAARGEKWNDTDIAERRQARDVYAIARCSNCGETFANLLVLWRHRPQDVSPDKQRCLSERQLYRLGMYRVAGRNKGDGIWHDDGRASPLGKGVGLRGDDRPETRMECATEGLPVFDS
jgi:hypothetical protein